MCARVWVFGALAQKSNGKKLGNKGGRLRPCLSAPARSLLILLQGLSLSIRGAENENLLEVMMFCSTARARVMEVTMFCAMQVRGLLCAAHSGG